MHAIKALKLCSLQVIYYSEIVLVTISGTPFMCVCVSVTSLTATSLTYRYQVRYESKASVVMNVFDSWFYEKYFSRKLQLCLLTTTDFVSQPLDTSEDFLMIARDYW